MNNNICLNMIVKNESPIIIKTLNNIFKYLLLNTSITYYVICDTGSTDNTIQVITSFFKKKGIAGKIIEEPFVDFGYNRTLALNYCKNETNIDYVFIFDADDYIIGDLVLPTILTKDAYWFKFGKDFTYIRPLLVSNKLQWEFKGVLHEYLNCTNKNIKKSIIKGDYYIESGRTGNRNKNPDKYLSDALILEHAYIKEPSELKNRYAFYCAQSYKDYGNILKAIEYYTIVLNLDNWVQEKYYSAFMLGKLYYTLKNYKLASKFFLKTTQYDSTRIEGIVLACKLYRMSKNYNLVHKLYLLFKNYSYPDLSKLFVITDLYNHQLEFEYSLVAYHLLHFDEGYLNIKKILKELIAPIKIILISIINLQYYKDQFLNDHSW